MKALPIGFLMLTSLLPGIAFGQEQNNADLPEPQRRAIAAIEKLGGLASRDERLRGKPVTDIRFYREIGDSDLEQAKAFPLLRSLSLPSGNITDAGMAQIGALTQLESLAICRSSITDAGLVHLQGMPQLKRLSVRDVPITDAGAKHLKPLAHLQTVEFRNTEVTEAGAGELKEALPYALVDVVDYRKQEYLNPFSGVYWLVVGLIVLCAGAAAICLAQTTWRTALRRRNLWKLPIVAGAILIMGYSLLWAEQIANPVRNGDAATFWLHACGIDVGAKHPRMYFGFYQPRDGWFIYYVQGFEERMLYKVKDADAIALFPKVVEKLQKAPPGALNPDVEKGFQEWRGSGAAPDDAAGLLAKLRDAQLERLKQENPRLFEYKRAEEDDLTERWQRLQHYPWNVRGEFLFLAGMILFAAWPWLRGSGHVRWAIHLGLLPVLFCLPYWLGYAPFTFTSAPSGGVLYPGLLKSVFHGLPWTSMDTYIVRSLPKPLEPLSQTPGPMLALAFMGGLGPVVVTGIGLAVAVATFAVGEVKRRLDRAKTENRGHS